MFRALRGPVLSTPTLLYLAGVPGARKPSSRSKLTRTAAPAGGANAVQASPATATMSDFLLPERIAPSSMTAVFETIHSTQIGCRVSIRRGAAPAPARPASAPVPAAGRAAGAGLRCGDRAGRCPSRSRPPAGTRPGLSGRPPPPGPPAGRSGPRLPPPPSPPSSGGSSLAVVAQAEEPDQPHHEKAHVKHAEADHEDPALGAHTAMLPRRGRPRKGAVCAVLSRPRRPGGSRGCPARRWPCSRAAP